MVKYADKTMGKKTLDYRERVIRVLSLAVFSIMFQTYMVAPLIPQISLAFQAPNQIVGLIIPAYLIPYGISTFIYGPLSDRLGRGRVMFFSLLAFADFTAFTATAHSFPQMMIWRLLTGISTSGVVPLALAVVGDLFPYEQRGRPLGLLFGAVAGGSAFGSTFGALMEPLVGWRGLFLGVGGLSIGVLVLLLQSPRLFEMRSKASKSPGGIRDLLATYKRLIGTQRGRQTYTYIFLNAVFQSGIFTWLGLYFARYYGLGEVGIGLALLGYGIPGFLLGPIIGKMTDRWGRRWSVPIGLGISAIAAGILIFHPPLVVAALAVTVLSLGHDLTQPSLTGIVSDLDRERGGQAMGLNTFALFIGFGLGSFLFGEALRLSFSTALTAFSAVQMVAALVAILLFRSEFHLKSKPGFIDSKNSP